MADLRALVVDDEPLARDELCFMLGEVGATVVVGQAGESSQALALLEELEPDAVFVDLRMPGPDGLALAEAIMARRPGTPVVVVSAHDEGALRAFEVGVADYLLKPARLDRVKKAIERVRERLGDTLDDAELSDQGGDSDAPLRRLAVRRKGSFVVLDLEDVLWFEVKDELVWAITASDRFALDLTLSNIERRVPDTVFFRSHRGCLVRLSAIVRIEPTGGGTFELVLDHPDAPHVPLARERARLLREIIPIVG